MAPPMSPTTSTIGTAIVRIMRVLRAGMRRCGDVEAEVRAYSTRRASSFESAPAGGRTGGRESSTMRRPEVHRVDERPAPPMDGCTTPGCERHLVRGSRVATVGLEPVPRVVLRLERHHAIAGDLGEHGRRCDRLRARVTLHDHADG